MKRFLTLIRKKIQQILLSIAGFEMDLNKIVFRSDEKNVVRFPKITKAGEELSELIKQDNIQEFLYEKEFDKLNSICVCIKKMTDEFDENSKSILSSLVNDVFNVLGHISKAVKYIGTKELKEECSLYVSKFIVTKEKVLPLIKENEENAN